MFETVRIPLLAPRVSVAYNDAEGVGGATFARRGPGFSGNRAWEIVARCQVRRDGPPAARSQGSSPGQGEPLHNLHAVIRADAICRSFGSQDPAGEADHNLHVGILPRFERFTREATSSA